MDKNMLQANVQEILDTLTTNRTTKTLKQLQKLKTDSKVKVKIVIENLYQSAVQHPDILKQYALLCKRYCRKMHKSHLTIQGIKKLLLTIFQKEFLQHFNAEHCCKLFDDIEDELYPRNEPKQSSSKDKSQIKQHMLNNIRFIIELKKVNLVNSSAIHKVIEFLLQRTDQASSECLLLVFCIIGKKLEDEELFQDDCCLMEGYFNRIHDILYNLQISTKTRCVLEEIIDLRLHKWIPLTIRPENVTNNEFCEENKIKKMRVVQKDRVRSTCGRDLVPCTRQIIPFLENKDVVIVKMLEKVEESFKEIQHDISQTFLLQFNELNIFTEERLKFIVCMIHEKAVICHDTSKQWAEICEQFCLNLLSAEQFSLFEELLLKTCWREMIKVYSRNFKNRQNFQNESQAERASSLVVENSETKKAMMGNTNFILELFKLQITDSSIIHRTINLLLQNVDEVSVECLYTVFVSIGEILDDEKICGKKINRWSFMDRYFNVLTELIKKGSCKSRIQLILKCIVDLRSNKWIPKEDHLNSEKNKVRCIEKYEDESVRKVTKTQSESICKKARSFTQLPQRSYSKCSLKRLQVKDLKIWKMLEHVRKIIDQLEEDKLMTGVVSQIETLGIQTAENLEYLAEVIYEKAISNPDTVSTWANLCYRLNGLQPEMKNYFKSCISQTCRQELMKLCRRAISDETKHNVSKNSQNCKNKRNFIVVEDLWNIRSSLLGNIRFTVELFKLQMVGTPFIHGTIKLLLHRADELSVECLCILLVESGKDLEREKITFNSGKNYAVDVYVSYIHKIVDKSLISGRTFFMTEKVFALWQHNWIPYDDNNAIHRISNRIYNVKYLKERSCSVFHNSLSSEPTFQSLSPSDQNEDVQLKKILRNVEKTLHQIIEDLPMDHIDAQLFYFKGITVNKKKKLEFTSVLIHNKAIEYPDCSIKLARFCHHLSTVLLSNKSDQRCLVKCISKNCEREIKKICFLKGQNEKQFEHAKDAVTGEEEHLRNYLLELNRQIQNNLKYIANLISFQIVKMSVVGTVVKCILYTGDNVSLESLWTFLNKIGKTLYQEISKWKGKSKNDYSLVINEILEKESVSIRVRLMLKEAVLNIEQNTIRTSRSPPLTIKNILQESSVPEQEKIDASSQYGVSSNDKSSSSDPLLPFTDSMTEDRNKTQLHKKWNMFLTQIKETNESELLNRLKITTVSELEEIVDVVYHMACTDTSVSSKCAALFKKLTEFNIPETNGDFVRNLLLTKFEDLHNCCNEQLRCEKLPAVIDATEFAKCEHKENANHKETTRGWILGNTTFLLHLHTFSIINIPDLINFVTFCLLLHESDEVFLECLCLVILSRGNELITENKNLIDYVFECLKEALNNKHLSQSSLSLLEEAVGHESKQISPTCLKDSVNNISGNGKAHHLSPYPLSPMITNAHHLSPYPLSIINTNAHHLSPYPLSTINTNAPHLSPYPLSTINTNAHHLFPYPLSTVKTKGHHLSPYTLSTMFSSAVLQDEDIYIVKTLEEIILMFEHIKSDKMSVLQLRKLSINFEDLLHLIALFIYEEAIDSCDTAKQWAEISKKWFVSLPLTVKCRRFMRILLKICQQKLMMVCSRKAKSCTLGSNDNKQAEMVPSVRNVRKEMLGNVRFTLELFKLRLTDSLIIHRAINVLLERADEVAVECLCEIFTALGMEQCNKLVFNRILMKNYFEALDEISTKTLLNDTVQLMLNEVFDLESRKWVFEKYPLTSTPCDAFCELESSKKRGKPRLDFERDELESTVLLAFVSCPLSASSVMQILNEDANTMTILSQIMEILDQVTTENHDSTQIVSQIKDLKLDTEDRVAYLVEFIYEKTIECPSCMLVLSNICNQQFGHCRTCSFKEILLSKYQKELKRLCSLNLYRANRVKHVNDIELKNSKSHLNEEELRRQMLHIIRFILELFKLQIIDKSFLHNAIKLLLQGCDDISMESLCTLLNETGKHLEQEGLTVGSLKVSVMDIYVTDIRKLLDMRETSEKIVTMMENFITLRGKSYEMEK